MAEKRKIKQTFVTHDLGVDETANHFPVHSMSVSDHIGDIVPGIEVDEDVLSLESKMAVTAPVTAVRTTQVEIPGISSGALGVPGKERNEQGTMVVHPQPSGASMSIDSEDLGDDLDNVLSNM